MHLVIGRILPRIDQSVLNALRNKVPHRCLTLDRGQSAQHPEHPHFAIISLASIHSEVGICDKLKLELKLLSRGRGGLAYPGGLSGM